MSRTKRVIGYVEGRVERVGVWIEESIVGRVWERMLEIEFVDRGIALAGKAFVSFFPLVIVVAAFVPASVRDSIIATLVHRLGIVGEARAQVRSAFASAEDIRRATGVFGLILTFFFASSFTTALQRVFLRSWRRPSGGAVYSYVRGISWLTGFVAYMALMGWLRGLLGNGAAAAGLFLVLVFASAVLVWTTTAWLMLRLEVRFRVLLPTGAFIALLVSVYGLVAPIWMPTQIRSNLDQFGVFGITLALITWLSGMALCILLSACTGVVLAEDDGPLGRIARLGAPSLLVEGARPALGTPIRHPGLLSSLVRPVEGEGD
jgi:membrane protein